MSIVKYLVHPREYVEELPRAIVDGTCRHSITDPPSIYDGAHEDHRRGP